MTAIEDSLRQHIETCSTPSSQCATSLKINPRLIVDRVISGKPADSKIDEIQALLVQTTASLSNIHPDYGTLAGRLCIKDLHQKTPDTFSNAMNILHQNNKITTYMHKLVINNPEIDTWIDHSRDYDFDYFGYKTLERSYLLRDTDNAIVERPQYMFMRVALAIHSDLVEARRTYDMMSRREFVHSTPTLFNAGTPHQQMSSCFLLSNREDSVEGIYGTVYDCAVISKHCGGIGLAVQNVRARGTRISQSGGCSNGIVPLLRVINASARYIDHGGGKRKANIAVYLEPWHADVLEFLEIRKNTGVDETRARDLFTALWIPDIFMRRLKAGQQWSLFCPHQCPGLVDTHGAEFDELYSMYEQQGKAVHTIQTTELWRLMLVSQLETGTPYVLFKDHVNNRSNQRHLGTIRSANLCTEIVQYSNANETAVCNLASICLPACVSADGFCFDKLERVVEQVTINLDRVIDANYYPTPYSKRSNLAHRPIGIGVQGLADVFAQLKLPFTSTKAKQLNRDIFETVYYTALKTSASLASSLGAHPSFHGSPASMGELHCDSSTQLHISARYDWAALRELVKGGLRNSLLVAAMPTATTSQIMGNCESFEPLTSNMYVRRVASGEFVVVNKHLVSALERLGKWTHETRTLLMRDGGSVQQLDVPEELKQVFKTVWELNAKELVEMARDRGEFIDQSQSMNIYLSTPNISKLSSLLMYGWEQGLKTGMYYLRTKSATQPLQFTIDSSDPESCLEDAACLSCEA